MQSIFQSLGVCPRPESHCGEQTTIQDGKCQVDFGPDVTMEGQSFDLTFTGQSTIPRRIEATCNAASFCGEQTVYRDGKCHVNFGPEASHVGLGQSEYVFDLTDNDVFDSIPRRITATCNPAGAPQIISDEPLHEICARPIAEESVRCHAENLKSTFETLATQEVVDEFAFLFTRMALHEKGDSRDTRKYFPCFYSAAKDYIKNEQDYYEHDTLQQKLDVLNELKTNGFDSLLFKGNHIYQNCARHPKGELWHS